MLAMLYADTAATQHPWSWPLPSQHSLICARLSRSTKQNMLAMSTVYAFRNSAFHVVTELYNLCADTAAITGHWNNITALVLPSNVTLTDTAELYAKLNVAFYDSNIAAWYVKFTSLFWRPVSAIT